MKIPTGKDELNESDIHNHSLVQAKEAINYSLPDIKKKEPRSKSNMRPSKRTSPFRAKSTNKRKKKKKFHQTLRADHLAFSAVKPLVESGNVKDFRIEVRMSKLNQLIITAQAQAEGEEEEPEPSKPKTNVTIETEMDDEYVIFLNEKKMRKVMKAFDNTLEAMVNHIAIVGEKLVIVSPSNKNEKEIKVIPETTKSKRTSGFNFSRP